MSGRARKAFALAVVGALCCVGTIATAQTVDVNGPTAGSTAKTEKGTQVDGSNPTAGEATRLPNPGAKRADNAPAAKGRSVIVPHAGPRGAGSTVPLNGDESGVAPRADLAGATGPKGRALRSADSTAHQTIYDPNDQLGTSLEGKTKPVTVGGNQNGQDSH